MLITRFLSYGNQKFTSLYKCNANDVAGTSMENRSPSASTIMTPVVEAVPNPDENVLRKHVEFFDRNSDGIVYPWETYQGFRAIGAGVALSAISAVFINAGLSAKTRPGKGFSILFPIEIANIQFAIHGSDTGVYDSEGRFVASKFEEIFTKYAHTDPNFLTGDELQELLKANREPKDYKGWVAAWAEWKVLYLLGKDPSGVLHKDTVRRVYDGSLFLKLDKETASSI